jgi:hypothetical protein
MKGSHFSASAMRIRQRRRSRSRRSSPDARPGGPDGAAALRSRRNSTEIDDTRGCDRDLRLSLLKPGLFNSSVISKQTPVRFSPLLSTPIAGLHWRGGPPRQLADWIGQVPSLVATVLFVPSASFPFRPTGLVCQKIKISIKRSNVFATFAR